MTCDACGAKLTRLEVGLCAGCRAQWREETVTDEATGLTYTRYSRTDVALRPVTFAEVLELERIVQADNERFNREHGSA